MSVADPSVPGWVRNATSWTWRLLLFALAAAVVAWVAARLYLVTLPLLIALILATLAVPPAAWLTRRGLPKAAAAAIVVLGGIGALVGIGALIAPSFADQIEELVPTITEGWQRLLDWLADLGYDRERLEELIAQARERAGASSSRILSGVASGAMVLVELLASLALMLVLLFFFVKDGDEIVGWLQARSPARHREAVSAAGARAWSALSGYVRGTALVALIDAIGIGIGLLVIGVPLVLPLALLVFFGAFLPVVGAFVAGLIALLVALAAGGFGDALAVLALILVVQQVEGNVLQPMIMRRTVALHPVVVLIALTAGASIAGVVGAFLAVPITAVAAAVGNEARLRLEGDDRAGEAATAGGHQGASA